jgi:hypothetical protein
MNQNKPAAVFFSGRYFTSQEITEIQNTVRTFSKLGWPELIQNMQVPGNFLLPCSLTGCCDLSGESHDDGRFPVRPSSLIPNVIR